MSTPSQQFWNTCSSCKKPIAFGSLYYLCSVSTCRQKRTGLRFCSVGCWDAHLGFANHRSSWAEEAIAPGTAALAADEAPIEVSASEIRSPSRAAGATPDRAPKRSIVESSPTAFPSSGSRPSGAQTTGASSIASSEIDTLVVVSKVKGLIRDRSGYNTSQCCIDALTARVVEECLKAIEQATAVGRKTVMGRDVVKR